MKKLILLTVFILLPELAISESYISAHSDGVLYHINSSEKVSKPDVFNCGRNDLGLPIHGLFERQTRQYTKWEDNKLIDTWVKIEDVFQTCHQI